MQIKTIKGDKEGPHLLILGGVHGDEYEPIAAAKRVIGIVPDVIKNGKVTIVPVVNFPAFLRASRVGGDGLDLARICPGNKEGTTTEIIAAEVSELISKSDFLIDLHTGGNAYEIAPFCGYTLHPSKEVLDKQRQMAMAFNLPTVWGTSSTLDGRTLSVARDNNIPAIYAEFGGGGGLKKDIVKDYVQGCLNVMNKLEMTVEKKIYFNRCENIMEDPREESGYLQVLLPAQSDGFFESKVKLGDYVQKDQVIGTITNFFEQSVLLVNADQDGMVFILRAIPSVKKGDSLGGIWPISKSDKTTKLWKKSQ